MDRDGCLTEEVGYVNHPTRIRLLPRTAEAVRRLNQAGVPAVMVTNQTGIARPRKRPCTPPTRAWQSAAAGARGSTAPTCHAPPERGQPPYRADRDRRKPRPGLRIARRQLDLDLTASVMVGDKPSDVAAGHAVGAGASW